MLMTTADMIRLLNANDPEGTKVLSFRVFNQDVQDSLVAHGEVSTIDVSVKHARQTEEGDRDIIRLDLVLDCDE